jgi:DNA-binding NarL/FixJ family response regulator
VTRVIVADDQELVRAGFVRLLEAEPGVTVVGQAVDGREAVELCRAARPDVALMDVRMPAMDGIAATREVTRSTKTKVLVLTTYDLDEYVLSALRAGASGFLVKDSPPDELLHAIRVVARGDALISPRVTRRLVSELVRMGRTRTPPELDRLTSREHEVLLQLARGRSNAEIAADLHLGGTTVKSHVASVLGKLGLRDRVHAVVFAYEHGLVRPGDAVRDD